MPTRKNFPSYKARRKEGADKRAAERAKLTPAEKLERAIGAKEKAKYTKQVETLAAKK